VQILKLGASGSDVVKLQKRLLELGLNLGSADG
jgi:peptidoglycan hydrolase-like protein with peptidoglycan-binding domain